MAMRVARFRDFRRSLLVLLVGVLVCLCVGIERLVATTPISSDCREAATPIIEALVRFRGTYRRYPADLSELVSQRFLRAIPRLPWAFDVNRSGYGYKVGRSGDSYQLIFSEQDVGIMTSWRTYVYSSRTGFWERGPYFPGSRSHGFYDTLCSMMCAHTGAAANVWALAFHDAVL